MEAPAGGRAGSGQYGGQHGGGGCQPAHRPCAHLVPRERRADSHHKQRPLFQQRARVAQLVRVVRRAQQLQTGAAAGPAYADDGQRILRKRQRRQRTQRIGAERFHGGHGSSGGGGRSSRRRSRRRFTFDAAAALLLVVLLARLFAPVHQPQRRRRRLSRRQLVPVASVRIGLAATRRVSMNFFALFFLHLLISSTRRSGGTISIKKQMLSRSLSSSEM